MTGALALVVVLTTTLTHVAPQEQGSGAERIVEIRVHGNHTTPDAEVIRIAGVSVGQPFSDSLVDEIASHLRQSGRFRSAEVRKRYASIDDPTAIILVIVLEELPGVATDVPKPGPLRRFGASTMWLPVLTFEDGYGFTYGARFSFVDVIGRRTRISVPLTWGGERRASAELERRFTSGPLTRVAVEGGVTWREHPALDVGDRRTGVAVRAERAVTPWLRVGARGGLADVSFGGADDRLRTAAVDATVDTRRDPAFPRNAVYASASVERLWFDHAADTHRIVGDARAYVGVFRQIVLVLRAQQVWAADRLPAFEQPLLGGTQSLRGFRLGYRMNDRLVAGSAELRMPISSPLSIARAGIAVFTDSGTVYGAGEELAHTRWNESIGAGFFITAPILSLRLDVAHGFDAGTRAHFTFGVSF